MQRTAVAILLMGILGCTEVGSKIVADGTVSPLSVQVVGPLNRADSIGVVRQIARALAIALADSALRLEFADAMSRSSANEGKIHLQRFLQGSGRSLASRIESRIGAQAGSLSSSASSIQDLEVYLPISAQRAAWHGDSRIVVAGFTESEDELRAREALQKG